MSDHVPGGIDEIAQLARFHRKLLYAILAEKPKATGVSLTDAISVDGLRDRHTLDVIELTASALYGQANPFLNSSDTFGDRACRSQAH
jgi:hypothetical protein